MSYQHPQDAEVIHSLSRIEGHVRAIKKMAETGEPCADILHQISAVRAAMKKVAQTVVLNHVDHYVNQPDIADDVREMLADIKDALGSYLRRPI
ncbi:MAG: metal-sensitive transcriptional regulator [Chloroflexota bacterium]